MPATTTAYDKLVNVMAPYATPCLVNLACAFKPIYDCTDYFCCKNLEYRDPDRPSARARPVVVFLSVTVKDVVKYTKLFNKWATETQKASTGIRALFSFMDTEHTNTALQFAWYDGPEDFVPQPTELTDLYCGTTKTDCNCEGRTQTRRTMWS